MTSRSAERRRHRAASPATAALPRGLKRAIGAGALAVLMAGSVAFATVGDRAGQVATQSAAGPDLDQRSVWSQVSRDGGERTSLDFLEADPVTFTVVIDDEELEITSAAPTLAEALIDHGVLVGLDDQVSAKMNQPPPEGGQVDITRVGTVYGAETEVIEHDTEERTTSSLPRGTRQVQTEGVDGERVVTSTLR